MEAKTHQLSTYPHLIPVAADPAPIYQPASFHRCSLEIWQMSDYDVQSCPRSENLDDINYQDITAHHVNSNTATKHRRMISGSSTPASKYGSYDRKGELRYDFKFGGNFSDYQDASSKQLRGGRDRTSVFTVASARTLCSQSSEPPSPTSASPPSSPFPPHSTSLPSAITKPPYEITSHSTLTPVHQKNHRLYCRLKTLLFSLLHINSSPNTKTTTAIKFCQHKFHHGRCNKCDLPEAILPYLDGGLLKAGFHCKEYGCEACNGFTSTTLVCGNEVYGSEEELRVAVSKKKKTNDSKAPLRIRSSIQFSSPYTSIDTTAADTSSIPDQAPQIGPIDFIPISNANPTLNIDTSDCTSERSFVSTNLSSDSILDLFPTPHGTPVGNSSPTEYSLHVPSYPPTHHIDASPRCQKPTIIATNTQAFKSSPQSTESTEVLEVNVPATAMPIHQASPTTIRIRHSKPTNQPPHTPQTVQNLCDIAHGAVGGDTECQAKILRLYYDMSNPNCTSDSAHHSELECVLIRKARLVLGLGVQRAARRVPAQLVEKVLVQFFPRDGDETMCVEEFAAYIRLVVARKEVSGARGAQILELAG